MTFLFFIEGEIIWSRFRKGFEESIEVSINTRRCGRAVAERLPNMLLLRGSLELRIGTTAAPLPEAATRDLSEHHLDGCTPKMDEEE